MPDIPRADCFSLAYITRTFLQRTQEARATDGEHQGVRARSAPRRRETCFRRPLGRRGPRRALLQRPSELRNAPCRNLRFGLPHIDSHISQPGNPRASTKLNDPGPRSRGRDGKFSARNSLDSTADVASRSSAAMQESVSACIIVSDANKSDRQIKPRFPEWPKQLDLRAAVHHNL